MCSTEPSNHKPLASSQAIVSPGISSTAGTLHAAAVSERVGGVAERRVQGGHCACAWGIAVQVQCVALTVHRHISRPLLLWRLARREPTIPRVQCAIEDPRPAVQAIRQSPPFAARLALHPLHARPPNRHTRAELLVDLVRGRAVPILDGREDDAVLLRVGPEAP